MSEPVTREEIFVSFEETGDSAKKKKEAKKRRWDGFVSAFYFFIRLLTVGILIVTVVSCFIVRIIQVSGTSMDPTYRDKDAVLMSCVDESFGRGDVVVISREPKGEQSILKRVIAVEGDTVDIDFENNCVYVNNRLVDEPYLAEPMEEAGDYNFPVTVPEGCVFVLGDNRNVSLDSRYLEIGFVPRADIFGKVILRVFPDFGKAG